MRESDLLHLLADPACFPGPPPRIELVQTHISIVCLAGDLVFKLKKALQLPFADFSTLERRRHFCREEVRLNRRLCPAIYLGTSALRATPAGARFAAVGDDDSPHDLDVAVVMRRLPADRMLDQQLQHGTVDATAIESLARIVAAFHRDADSGAAVRAAGAPAIPLELARANFRELAAMSHDLDAALLAALQSTSLALLLCALPLLQRRAAAGRVVDGHGDLHARNICMTEPPAIYDCIEFEPAFRCGDVATEVAFLVMDLRYRDAGALASAFVAAYVDASGDADLPGLLPPLVAYRAMVRAKVAALAAAAPDLSAADRAGAAGSAAAHLQLAAATVLATSGPQWLLLCGPPGSGKSTIAAALQRGTHWPVVATDRVRKELAGLPPTARAQATAYTDEFSANTYATVLARAVDATRSGAATVVLDGNFPDPAHRAAAAARAATVGARLTVAHVDVDAALGRQRLAARLADPARISDAGPEQHDALRLRFRAPSPDEGLAIVHVDGSAAAASASARLLAAMLAAVQAPA